jgi:DNA-binding NarL/FixJ family response regulator
MIKVAVFDDNKTWRDMLEMYINSTPGMQCTGTFEDCRQVVKNIKQDIPDVVLMDIDMPHVDGIDGLQLIKKQFPSVKILMQTVFDQDEKIFDAIRAGADGYLLKKTPPEKIMDAISELLDGGAPMTPTVARQVLQLFSGKTKKPQTGFDLTGREHEILALLVRGLSYKMIAAKICISFPTVNSHISNIYKKLHVNSGTEAVAKAIEQGLV